MRADTTYWVLSFVMLMMLVFVICWPHAVLGQQFDRVSHRMVRWYHAGVADGFTIHVMPDESGVLEEFTFNKDDPGLSTVGNVYGAFLQYTGTVRVTVSAFTFDGGWSDPSQVWYFGPEENDETIGDINACQMSDLSGDGSVGGPDFTFFSKWFGSVCEDIGP